METANYIQAFAALVFVIALIGLSAVVYRRFVLDKNFLKGGKPRRLQIEEQIYLDAKRKLVIVKKDETEILILLGANSESVISHQSLKNNVNLNEQIQKKASHIKSAIKKRIH